MRCEMAELIEGQKDGQQTKKVIKVSLDTVNEARRLLLESVYSDEGEARYQRREVVRQLMGTIQAAKNTGLPFEKIAEIITQSGIEISVSTLKQYYYELKAEAEVAKHANRQAREIQDARRAVMTKRDMAIGSETHAAVKKAAREKVTSRMTKSAPVLMTHQELRREGDGTGSEKEETTPPPQRRRVREDKPPPDRTEDAKQASGSSPPSPPPGDETASLDAAKAKLSRGRPLTIADLRALSSEVTGRVDLAEDVVLKDGHALYAKSGKPLDRALAGRQVTLLAQAKRLIASGSKDGNRSGSNFVKMPEKL